MPKINKGTMRNSSKVSSRTRRRIIQVQNQDAKMANNLVQSSSADNSSRSPLNTTHAPANSFILPDNTETQFSNNNLFVSDNTVEIQVSNNNFFPSDNHHVIDGSTATSQLFSSNFEKLINVNNKNVSIQSELTEWAVKCKIAQCHLNELLLILRKHNGFGELPKDSRTLLQTPKINTDQIRLVNPNGKYFHFGLTNYLLTYFSNLNYIPNEIQLVIGVDGLPISHSSNSQLWPILAYVKPNNYIQEKKVFPIGLFWGKSKPTDSNEFLYDFIVEAKILLTDGIKINQINQPIPVSIFAICCDAPAKSFLTKTKGHTGFASCSKCTQEGVHLRNRTCFPYKDNFSYLRTHDSFVLRTHEEYHITNVNTILLDLPNFNIVEKFSLDYMHLTCLGVMRKLILLWMKGPLSVRLPSSKIKLISSNLRSIKNNIPVEFSRKPRDLEEICRWKATELRQLLIYSGPLVLKDSLSEKCYTNFMAFHISMVILISPNLGKYLEFAHTLLNYFVKSFQIIYGKHLISHNIHGLLHLCQDYKLFGPLDSVSCFPFENFMKTFKAMLRKHEKPLEQIVKRFKEIEINISNNPNKNRDKSPILKFQHNNGPLPNTTVQGNQYKMLILTDKIITIKIDKESDCYFGTLNNDVVKVFNIIKDLDTEQIIIVGKIFTKKTVYYQKPIKSKTLNIFIVNKLSKDFMLYCINDIVNKYIVFTSYGGDCKNNIAMPLLHTHE